MQRAKINAASTLLYQLVSTACGIVIPWIMIEKFGSVAYGATTSIAQFLAYIALFEGGVGRVSRAALYGPLAVGDVERISGIYLATRRFFRLLGIAFVGYALILACFYYDISNVVEFTREYVFVLVLVIAIGKFAEYMGGITNITLFNADQKQYIVNLVMILTTVMNVVLVVVLANAGVDILWVKLVSSLVFVLKPILFTIYLKTHYKIHPPKKRVVLENKATGIAQHMAYVVQNNTDVLILTIFADLKAVAVYSVYHLISFSLRNITSSFGGGMEAVFGNMIAKDEQQLLVHTHRKYKLTLTFLTIALFGTACALIVPFVKLYTYGTTDANYIQPTFAILMLLSDAINCLILPCFNLSIAANKLKESKIGAYGEAAVNLGLSLILVFWNPLIGIAIGTLASAIFKSMYYMIFAGKHILKTKTSRLLRDFFVTVAVLVLSAVIGMTITSYMPLYNYWRWMLAGGAFVIAMCLVAMTIGMICYPKIAKEYMCSLKKKISR